MFDEIIDNRTMKQKIEYWMHCKTLRFRTRVSRFFRCKNDPIPY